jgi:hypothetical protein
MAGWRWYDSSKFKSGRVRFCFNFSKQFVVFSVEKTLALRGFASPKLNRQMRLLITLLDLIPLYFSGKVE